MLNLSCSCSECCEFKFSCPSGYINIDWKCTQILLYISDPQIHSVLGLKKLSDLLCSKDYCTDKAKKDPDECLFPLNIIFLSVRFIDE